MRVSIGDGLRKIAYAADISMGQGQVENTNLDSDVTI